MVQWRSLAIVLVFAPLALAAQGRREVVRGRVTGEAGAAVPGASVVITRLADGVARVTSSGPDGAYAMVWEDGTGDYAVAASAVGFQSRTVHAVRGADSVIVADVMLVRAVQQLAPVHTQVRPVTPDHDPASYGAGGSESQAFIGNAGRRLPPEQIGDLNAVAAMLPGVASTTGGISVLGLPPNQNSVTLSGLAFPGSDVPRDATTRLRVITSSYDPAIGWFSGAQAAVDLTIGNQFASRTSHWTLDAPALQFTDPISARSGQEFRNFNVGLGGNGQLVDQRWAYNYGLQAGRKSADMASLLNADASLLAHDGVSADSARRLIDLLALAGVPVTSRAVPGGLIDDNVSFIGRIDHAPYDWSRLEYSRTTYGLQAYAKWSRSGAQGLNALATPAHAGQVTQTIVQVTGVYTTLFGQDYLASVKSGVSFARTLATPYLALPDARALVVSDIPGGAGGVSTLQFGGNSGLQSDARTWRWETTGQVQLYAPGARAHRVKLATDLRFDAFTQDLLGNRYGSFGYNSLAAVAANEPATFTRTLSAPARRGGEWSAFASVGDLWRVNDALQVIYGARLEGNRFTAAPALNQGLAQSLGVRTDHVPDGVAVSPRLGFTWQRTPRTAIRGGMGEFRNLIDPTKVAGPSVATGLPGGLRRIGCYGPAVPVPDWRAYATDPAGIPGECTGGGGTLADLAPDVQAIGSAFAPQRSWRANLGFQSSVGRAVLGVDGIVSLNRGQPATMDRNFSGVPAFVAQDGRPVFVPSSGIVPSTGAVAPTASRIDPAFGRVLSLLSDQHSVSRAVVVTLRPGLPQALRAYVGDLNLSYTLSSMRARERGFDAPTFGDPTRSEWSRGDLDARHQIVGQVVLRPFRDNRALLFVYGRVTSGLPFTPMIGSDVNGDGLANDRAAIIDPTRTTDPQLARDMTRLLASAPDNVRRCLLRQLGRAADRNSCTGPWTAQLNASLRLSGQDLLRVPRMNVTINLANPLGGLDQLLHGSNRLHGWGAPPAPDPVLYTVHGFDASHNRFLYEVNPRFGSTSPALSAIRAPFRLTIDVSVDLGRSLPMQMLDRWLRPGRAGRPGTRTSEGDFFRRFQRTVPDPFLELMEQGDSLLLTDQQVTRLQVVDSSYRSRVDARWQDLARFLSGLGDSYDAGAAERRVDTTTDDIWEATRLEVQHQLSALLTPAQTALLSGWAGQLFRAHGRVHIRLTPAGG